MKIRSPFQVFTIKIYVSDHERKEMAKAPFDLKKYIASIDLADIHGEEGFTTVSVKPFDLPRCKWYLGRIYWRGAKTVIASEAMQKYLCV